MQNFRSGVHKEQISFDQPDFKVYVAPERTSVISKGQSQEKIYHEEIEIKYFYEGSATLMIDMNTVVTKPGDIVVINPYEFHATIDLDQEIGKYHLIILSLDFFVDQGSTGLNLRRILIGKRVCFNNLIRGNERMIQILQRVAQEIQQKEESYRLVVQGLLTEFFVLLLRREVSTEKSASVLEKDVRYFEIIDPAVQRIYSGYEEKITIDELAQLCSISKYHFCRIFRQITGMTALQFLIKYRLKIANIMLAKTNKSIAEIARECGFADESYFCRCYKKIHGISPNQNRAILS